MFQLFSGFISKPSLVLLAVLTFIGCSPTDENVFSYQERLNAGKMIKFDRPGEIPTGCRDRAWDEARLKAESAEDLVFAKIHLEIKSGWDNCYQIGAIIDVADPEGRAGRKNPIFKTQVDWVAIVKPKGDLRDIEKSLKLAVRVKDSSLKSYLEEKFYSKLISEIKYSQEHRDGVIQITAMRYIPQSASQQLEASYVKKGFERYQASFFEETKNDGEVLSSCGTKRFPDYRTTRATWELMQTGLTSTAWEVHPRLLCVPQGEVATLVSNDLNPDGSRETFGKIKIGKARRMKIESFKSSFLRLNGMDPNEAMTQIHAAYDQKMAKDKNARLFLIDFEVIP